MQSTLAVPTSRRVESPSVMQRAVSEAVVQHVSRTVAVLPANGSIGATLMAALLHKGGFDKLYGVVRESRLATCKANGVKVTFQGERTHLLPSKHPNLQFVASLQDVPDNAWLLVAVQAEQLLTSLTDVKDSHRVVLFQNGQGNYEKVRAFRGNVRDVHKAVMHVAAAKTGFAEIVPQRGKVQVGEPLRLFMHWAFEGNTIFKVEVVPDIDVSSWLKTLMNLGLNGLSTIHQANFARLANDPALWTLVQLVMDEACVVAWADLQAKSPGREYLRDHSLDEMKAAARADFQERASQHPEHLSSMQNTFIAGNPIEIGVLYEYVSLRAVELGVEAPLNALVTTTLKFLEDKRLRSSEPFTTFRKTHADDMARAAQELLEKAGIEAVPKAASSNEPAPSRRSLRRETSWPGVFTTHFGEVRLRLPFTGTPGSPHFELR